jgi:hypothetical protein
MARRQDNPDKPERRSWLPIVLILIGLAVPAGGLWFLSTTNRPPAAAAATYTPVPQPSATATSIPPTSTPSAVPTASTNPTHTAPTVTPTASPAAAAPGEGAEIAIVHSNDTWGYLLPCG